MNVDAVRRLWAQASEASEVTARLVACAEREGGWVLRGRTGASWSGRLRFERALAEGLGEQADGCDLVWLAPAPGASKEDRARAKLGMAVKPQGPVEVGSKVPAQRAPKGGKGPPERRPVPGARKILAVASGKGGVGKSTVAVNLALALKARGLKVGLLDADVYGPSIPTMLGSFQAPTREEGVFQPPVAQGLPFLSLGLMVNPDQSVIWRGPMVQRMVRDMLQGSAWPDLDVLVIDLPPGTGDVQLTLVQRTLLDGAVIVSTPQDIALIDAARGLEMFRKMDVPVLGIIENMASWSCPDCGVTSHPFGQDGGAREAVRLGVDLLGRIPLEPAVRVGGDQGKPVVLEHPESEASKAFSGLAARIAAVMTLDPAPDPDSLG